MEGTFELTRVDPEEAAAQDGDEKKDDKDEDEVEPVEIDFDDLEDRIRRISIPDASESRLLWSSDSKKLAFEASIKGDKGMYTVTFPDDLKPKKLTSTTGSYARWLKTGNQIAWLVSGRPATMSAGGKATSYGFSVQQVVDVAARHAAAFDQAWRVMRDQFYDERLNGHDWNAIHAKYRPMAASALTPDALETVVNMMLGELNGSHLGFNASSKRWSKSGWREITRHLGVFFDPAYEGPGLRIRDVVPDTPADEERHRLEAGEVILAIDGVEVGPHTRLARVLTGPAEREVVLKVRGAEDAERTVTFRPTTYGSVRRRLYDMWLDQERATVERLGEGRLGYLHVRGMSWPSFERFETELYKVGHGKEGLIIDVRNNGGGFTTDHLLTVLTQPRHAMTIGRGGKPGYPQDRMVYARWDRPVVVLCNQNSFSNAEIFAHAIKTLKRGRVVGVRTAGGVISTGGTKILDVGSLRLPFRGWFLLDSGEDMERNGCVPDVTIWPEPGEMPAGKDRQLEKAVEVLLEDVEAARASGFPKPRYASERSATDGD
jgi:tricorn protease